MLMQHRRTPALIPLVAAVLAAAMSSTALARTAIRVTPAGAFQGTAADLRFEAVGGGLTVTCRVVLRGSLHGEISKTPYSLVGVISSGTATHPAGGPCDSSLGVGNTRVTLLFPEDWHLAFLGFDGSLPLIDIIYFLLEKIQFELKIGGDLAVCLYGDHLEIRSNLNVLADMTSLKPAADGILLLSSRGLIPALCPRAIGIVEEWFYLYPSRDLSLID